MSYWSYVLVSHETVIQRSLFVFEGIKLGRE